MENWDKEFLKKLRQTKGNYLSMIEFCCNSLILNNEIITELQKTEFYFDNYCGSEVEYLNEKGEEITLEQYEEAQQKGEEVKEYWKDFYQYYIIDNLGAERLAEYTNEVVYYCDKLNLYILAVSHFGSSWSIVPANWKEIETE